MTNDIYIVDDDKYHVRPINYIFTSQTMGVFIVNSSFVELLACSFTRYEYA